MEAVALWVNRKPNKEFDLQMTGSQEVLFWYERTIISLQFLINLICRKYFRIQASMNTGVAWNILKCDFEFDERKKCKCSNQKVYSTDAVSATEFSQISEIDNTISGMALTLGLF